MLAANKAIISAKQVQEAFQEQKGHTVDVLMARQVMRRDMHLGYRLAKTVAVQCNTERCLVLRQQFAIRMIPLLDSGCFSSPPARRVINIDESWLNETRFVRRIWVPSDGPATVSDKQVQPRISVIAALDTEGRVWCALTQANTDTDVMTTFLRHLMRQLDHETPGWEENTTLLLDNASWHTNLEMKQRLAKLVPHVIYTGPYSYSSAPIELLFAGLKLGELNPERLPTGKR